MQNQGTAGLNDRAETTEKQTCRSRASNLLDPNPGLMQASSSAAIHEGSIAGPLLNRGAAEALRARTTVSEANSHT